MSRRRSRGARWVWAAGDDAPLSLVLAGFAKTRKQTPRKKTTKRRPQRTVASSSVAAAAAAPQPNAEVFDLDDSIESASIVDHVDTKIGTFLESGSLLSSDEDEVEMVNVKKIRKTSSNPIFISDDSDDDILFNEINTAVPSTSTASHAAPFDVKMQRNDNQMMNVIDSILEDNKFSVNRIDSTNSAEALTNLKNYQKETEEMLENASRLLAEFKNGHLKEEEKPPQLKKKEGLGDTPTKAIGCCPVCLESLSGVPMAATVCGHIFCQQCIRQIAKTLKKCPTCRKSINLKKIHPIYL